MKLHPRIHEHVREAAATALAVALLLSVTNWVRTQIETEAIGAIDEVVERGSAEEPLLSLHIQSRDPLDLIEPAGATTPNRPACTSSEPGDDDAWTPAFMRYPRLDPNTPMKMPTPRAVEILSI